MLDERFTSQGLFTDVRGGSMNTSHSVETSQDVDFDVEALGPMRGIIKSARVKQFEQIQTQARVF